MPKPSPIPLAVTIHGSKIAYVGAIFDPAYPAVSWLSAGISGSGSSWIVNLDIAYELDVNYTTRTAHLLVGGADSAGNILVSTPVTVTYTIRPRFKTYQTNVYFSGVNGGATPAAEHVGVIGQGLSWTASVDAEWVHLDHTSGVTPADLVVSVDDASLSSGSHRANVTLIASDGQQTVLPVTYALSSAELTASPSSLALGGDTGRDASPIGVVFALGTAGNAYPWQLSALPEWLAASATSGTISDTPQSILFTPVLEKAAIGKNETTVVFTAQVDGDTLTRSIPVTLNIDEHRISLSEEGVALVSTPKWSRLSKTLQVVDNLGRRTRWTASSDQTWLSVTSSGFTGGNIVVRAAPAGLSADSLSVAKVVITSSDPTVSGPVTLLVGLWKGSATPSARVTKLGPAYKSIAFDPVRPYVYLHTGGSTIDVYNVYTASPVTTITGAATSLGTIVAAADGQTLYAVDAGFKRVSVISLSTMKKTGTISLTNPASGTPLQVRRIAGVELLVMGDGTAYRTSDGAQVSDPITGGPSGEGSLTFSLDGHTACGINTGISPSTFSCFSTDYTAQDAGKLVSKFIGYGSPGSNGQDIAIARDGKTIYAASGSPYKFVTYSATDFSPIGSLPGGAPYPNNVEVASDGKIAGGIADYYGDTDVWVYAPDGSIRSTFKISGYAQNLIKNGLVFSGDAMMLVGITDDPRLVFMPVGP